MERGFAIMKAWKYLKRVISAFFCAILLSNTVTLVPARAADNVVPMSEIYLNRAACWEKAGEYLNLGYSRQDLTVEIYGHAILHYVVNGTVCIDKGSFSICFPDTPLFKKLKAAAENHTADGINLGGDNNQPDKYLECYYYLWNHAYLSNCNEYYNIFNWGNPNQVIDVSGGKNNNGTKIQLWSINGTDAQQFEFFPAGVKDGETWYYIFKKGTFKCLDVTGGKKSSKVNVQLWGYNGSAAQEWTLVDAGYDSFYLRNRLGFYMDACGGKTDNGTQIWTYTYNGSDAQRWSRADVF